MRLRIGKRQGRAPGAAEHVPAHDAQVVAQALHVGDQQRRGVVGELAERCRAAGAALVEDDDAIMARVEEAAVVGAGPGTRAAVQERPEERRVGKEWGRKCRSRWAPYS